MKYPFEFSELLLTDILLKEFGFINWSDDCGDSNHSSITLARVKIEIHKTDELSDGGVGSYAKPEYSSAHFTNKDFHPMYFLHDLYEYIISFNNEEVILEFLELCKKNNTYVYIESYINYMTTKK
jgi:hypothetical protein